MHDSVQYDPIHGHGQDHDEPPKVGNSAIFKVSPPVYNGGWHMTTDS